MPEQQVTPAETAAEPEISVELELQEGFRFLADYGDPTIPPLLLDEAPPLGEGTGPNPAALLTTAVANCLAASLLFCLRKSRIEVTALHASGRARRHRNEAGRFRIAGVEVQLTVTVPAEQVSRVDRCIGLFEDYCIVTQSVRGGIDVDVDVSVRGA
jgi:organic hydroperoxide reductase OsmC/OhrA